MKKITALFTVCAVLLCTAVSCGKGSKDKKTDVSSETVTETTKAQQSDEQPAEESAAPEAEVQESAGEPVPAEEGEEAPEESSENVDEEAENTVGRYLKALIEDADAEAAANVLYPSNIVEAFRRDGQLDEKIFAGIEYGGGVAVEDFSVTKCEPLSEKTIAGAENFYEKYSDVFCGEKLDITVIDGRELDFSFNAVGADGSQETSQTYVVVKTQEEGYKLIPTDAETVDSLAD